MARYLVRPLGAWDRPITDPRRSASVFKAGWDATLNLLLREVEYLGGDTIAIQVDATEADLRRDGMLRANAKVGFPGVKVSFDSYRGPLTFASDAYERDWGRGMAGWQANVRAVALSLEALRSVDRWGVTSSGEQYRGWSAISATSGEFDMTREQAADLLAHDTEFAREQILASADVVRRAFRAAARRHHPDVPGGNTELFRRLKAAYDLLMGDGRG